jgi:hypothetical protein
VYVNIFSCKDFDPAVASQFAGRWFGGRIAKSTFVTRT